MALTQEPTGLAASYARRAWCVRIGSATLATGLVVALASAQAQEANTKSADKTPAKSSADKSSKAAGTTRAAAAGKQATGTSARGAGQTTAPQPAGGTPGLSIVPMQGRGAGGAGAPGRGVPGVGGQGAAGTPGAGQFPGAGQLPGRQFPGGGNFGGGNFGGGGGFGQGARGSTFSFEFRGSDIDNVLKYFSNSSGLTITKDPALTGPVTILSPTPVSLDQAFRILQSVLYVRGFTAVQSNGVLQILPFQGAIKSTGLLNPGINEDGTTRVDPRNQFMTQVIPIENVDADALARELKDLASPGASLIGSVGTNSLIITDTASNVSRFITLVEALDKTSNKTDLKIYALTRADASTIAQIINDLYSKTTTRGRSGGGQPQPGQPGFNPQQQQGGQQSSGSRPAVVAVADQGTNSVLVVASPDNQERIARDIITRLDGDDSNRLDTVTRKINFADAQTIADEVNSVLSNSRPGGGSSVSPSFQQRTFGGGGGGFGGFFGGFGGGGGNSSTGSSDPFGRVVADPRTNTVLITATKDRMTRIYDLIDKLDQEVPVESTTFVFPLKNANSSDVAQALGQAFGTTSNNNNNNFGNFGFGFGGSGQTARNPFGSQRQGSGSQRQLGSVGTGRGLGRATNRSNVPPGPPDAPDGGSNSAGDGSIQTNGGSAIPQGISGVMTDQGFIPTEPTGNGANNSSGDVTRQIFGGFGGFGGGRQQRLGQTQTPQYGPGRTGGYSNLLQLQGNVFVTPSPEGDNLIITTLPQNYEAVRQIIDALDIVPRQVMIEVIIAEVTLDSDQKLGFTLGGNFLKLFNSSNTAQGQLNVPAAGLGTTFDPAAVGAQFVISGGDYNTLIQALTTDNKVHVLATPRVFASNNQSADINIATQIPFLQGTTQSAFSSVVSQTVQTAQVGYDLTVTPRITRQGLVTIALTQEANSLVRFQTLGSGQNASVYPVINTRNTDTTVTVQDGETIVIGGLIQDNRGVNVTKIPLLGDIPLIGQFFRSRELTRSKTELMIFMTPHVVNTVEEARRLTLQQGAPVIRQIPDLSRQQPNLSLPNVPKGYKPDPNAPVIRDSSGKVIPNLDEKKNKATSDPNKVNLPTTPGANGRNGTGTNGGNGNGTGAGTGTNNGGTGLGTSNPTGTP